MCDLDYGYMGFTRNIIKIKGKTIQYDDMSIESACENENNVLLLKYNETHGITLLNGDKNTIENGIYIQNIGKIVLDGTQPLMFHSFSNDTYICAVYSDNSFDSVIYSSIYVEGEYKAISKNIMVPDSNTCGFNNRMGINAGIFMRFPISEVGVNIDQLNNYLKANNHIVYYKLAQPIYIPTNIQLPQPLRSLPNGVCDELVGNKLIQRIGKFTIDGSTILLSENNLSLNTIRLIQPVTDAKNATNERDLLFLTEGDIPKDHSIWSNDREGIFLAQDNNRFILRVNRNRFTQINQQGFIDYFSSNPMTLYYELSSPIEHTLDINIKKIKKSKCYNKIKPTII